MPGPWDRNIELRRQGVGVALVPDPADDIPRGRGQSEERAEAFAVAGDGGHRLIAGRKENPTLESMPQTQLKESRNGAIRVAQVGDSHAQAGEPRKARDRRLIVHDANRNAVSPQAAHDAEAQEVTA